MTEIYIVSYYTKNGVLGDIMLATEPIDPIDMMREIKNEICKENDFTPKDVVLLSISSLGTTKNPEAIKASKEKSNNSKKV
jgi:uncharacterized protein related to proFAR isomerase